MMDYEIMIPTCRPYGDRMLTDLRYRIRAAEPLAQISMSCITDGSAAKNRNFCLDHCKSEYVVMCDDDLAGVPADFALHLVATLQRWSHAAMCSAKLLNWHGEMFMGGYIQNTTKGIGVSRAGWVPTACVAFRKTDRRFDEGYLGSGYEDGDYCWSIIKDVPDAIFIVDNAVAVHHANEMKNQQNNWEANKARFLGKWGKLP